MTNNNTELTVLENRQLEDRPPAEIMLKATAQAVVLMDIVEKKKLYLQIGDKRHLYVEAWETIGAFNQSRAVPETIDPILEGDKVIGYEARVVLYRHGVIDGAGIGECRLSEPICNKRVVDEWKDRKPVRFHYVPSDNAHNACKSMAQTRATSKAYRTNYAWVAVLAGYAPTPAEEMISVEPIEAKQDYSPQGGQEAPYPPHYCILHKTKHLKGKSGAYGHIIIRPDGTKEPCMEQTVEVKLPVDDIDRFNTVTTEVANKTE